MSIQLIDLLKEIAAKHVKKVHKMEEQEAPARKKSMHTTSKGSKEAKEAGKKLSQGETPETRGHRAKKEVEARAAIDTAKKEKKRALEKGTGEYTKAMAAAKDEFDKWEKQTKLRKAISGEAPADSAADSAEDEGHKRALARALKAKAKKEKKASVTEETDAEHAKSMKRNISRYEKGGNAAHKAALKDAKEREAREGKK